MADLMMTAGKEVDIMSKDSSNGKSVWVLVMQHKDHVDIITEHQSKLSI